MTKRRTADAPEKPVSPTPQQVYRAAKAYIRNGLSLIPISADGTKRPAFELLPKVWDEKTGKYRRPWSGYKERRPTLAEVRAWFRDGGDEYGMCIIGGAVSGGLEIIDLDNWEVAERWSELVEKKSPDVLDRLVRVRSPRPGMHAYYRCAEFGDNQKLARIPDPEKDNKKPKTIIEIKGKGGYCLAPPSPAACHKTGRCYTFLGGKDLTQVPTISPEEREILLSCARQLNCWVEPQRPKFSSRCQRSKNRRFFRPGDDFNWRADWAEILEPYGWKWVQRGGDGSDHWRRPGKSEGSSATTNFEGSDLLFVFSANADPFEENTAYTKFSAYALLKHDSDFSAAARALAAQGYGGKQTRSRNQDADPFERYASYTVRANRSAR